MVFDKEVAFLRKQNNKVQKDNADLVKLNIKLKQILLSEAVQASQMVADEMLPSDYSSEDEWKEEKASMKVHIFGKRLKKA